MLLRGIPEVWRATLGELFIRHMDTPNRMAPAGWTERQRTAPRGEIISARAKSDFICTVRTPCGSWLPWCARGGLRMKL